MRRILFLCSGNYYRSRYAELVFNRGRRNLDWWADSAGLAETFHPGNLGPISPYVLARLGPLPEPIRFPRHAQPADFTAERIIALKASEHQPMLAARYPAFLPQVEFWNIHDTDVARPQITLDALDRAIEALLQDLAS